MVCLSSAAPRSSNVKDNLRRHPPTYDVVFHEEDVPEHLLKAHPPSVVTTPQGGVSSQLSAGSVMAQHGWQSIRHPNGTLFLCYVPSLEDAEAALHAERRSAQRGNAENDETAGSGSGAVTREDSSPSVADEPDEWTANDLKSGMQLPLRLRKPLQAKMSRPSAPLCSLKNVEWWTYEVCWESSVRQFHINTNSGQVEKEYFLGKGPSMRVVDGTDFDSLVYKEHPTHGPYVTSVYYNGTECDLTGRQRQTEVRLFCADESGGDSGESLTITEPKTCEYLVTWRSKSACIEGLRKESAVNLKLHCYREDRASSP